MAKEKKKRGLFAVLFNRTPSKRDKPKRRKSKQNDNHNNNSNKSARKNKKTQDSKQMKNNQNRNSNSTSSKMKIKNQEPKKQNVSESNSQTNNNLKPIPLKNGGRRWQIYSSKDYQVKTPSLKTVHPFLVIDEINDSITGISVTHSEGRSGKNYNELPNVIGEKSMYDKELKYLNKAKKNKVLKVTALLEKYNHRDFTYEEKLLILRNINSLPSNLKNYETWINLNKEKK